MTHRARGLGDRRDRLFGRAQHFERLPRAASSEFLQDGPAKFDDLFAATHGVAAAWHGISNLRNLLLEPQQELRAIRFRERGGDGWRTSMRIVRHLDHDLTPKCRLRFEHPVEPRPTLGDGMPKQTNAGPMHAPSPGRVFRTRQAHARECEIDCALRVMFEKRTEHVSDGVGLERTFQQVKERRSSTIVPEDLEPPLREDAAQLLVFVETDRKTASITRSAARK